MNSKVTHSVNSLVRTFPKFINLNPIILWTYGRFRWWLDA